MPVPIRPDEHPSRPKDRTVSWLCAPIARDAVRR